MSISRRGFMGALLAAAVAPAIVRASSLMPIHVPKIILPSYMTLWGDGLHDDQPALQALIAGGLVVDKAGKLIEPREGTLYLPAGTYAISNAITLKKNELRVTVVGSHIKALPGFPKEAPLIHLDKGANATLTDCHLTGAGGPAIKFSNFDNPDGYIPRAKKRTYL